MARYQVILVYDGTHFCGFQRQVRSKRGEANRTVQAELESALKQIGWTGSSILAAGRTDSGVHASGQVAAFDLDWKHSLQDLRAALNSNLPADVSARMVFRAAPDFHPRFDARERVYRYRLFCQDWRDPLRERYAWRVWPAVDYGRLAQAAAALPGTHDFSAFGSPPRTEGSPIRHVTRASWSQETLTGASSADLVFEIVANAFLYHMVRRLVFIQVAIGQGRLPVETLLTSLETPPEEMLQGLAPPQGLTLVEVLYPNSAGDTATSDLQSENL